MALQLRRLLRQMSGLAINFPLCKKHWSRLINPAHLRCFFLSSTSFFAHCLTKEGIDLKESDSSKLSQEYLLRNATGLTSDSVSTLLHQTARAIIDAEEKYREAVQVLLQLTEYQMTVLGAKTEEDRISDIIVEARALMEKLNKKRKDLELLFACVQKLSESAAEVAFLTGSEFSSTSLGEQLYNVQRHVQKAYAETHSLEQELQATQIKSIKALAAHADQLELKKTRGEMIGISNED